MSMDEEDWPPPPPAPAFSDTGLEPAARELLRMTSALVVFSGLAATGRSTSQAALIDVARNEMGKRVAIVGSPSRFSDEDDKGLPPIARYDAAREVTSQADGVRRALIGKSDLLQIPLYRSENAEAAVRAATSGVLVFTSLPALSPEQAYLRIFEAMPDSCRSELTLALSTVPVVILHHRREAVDIHAREIPRPTVTMRAWLPRTGTHARPKESFKARVTRLFIGDRGVSWPVA